MNIVAFMVRCQCPGCSGTKKAKPGTHDYTLPSEKLGGPPPYCRHCGSVKPLYAKEEPCFSPREVKCPECKGLGHVEGVVEWKAFEKLVYGIVNAAVDKAVKLSKGIWR